MEHVVITSVDRDDLIDGGAKHFYDVIVEIRNKPKEYSYKDVIALEYGIVQELYMGSGQFEKWFTYTGPNPIKLNDLTIHPNEMIEIIIDEYHVQDI